MWLTVKQDWKLISCHLCLRFSNVLCSLFADKLKYISTGTKISRLQFVLIHSGLKPFLALFALHHIRFLFVVFILLFDLPDYSACIFFKEILERFSCRKSSSGFGPLFIFPFKNVSPLPFLSKAFSFCVNASSLR